MGSWASRPRRFLGFARAAKRHSLVYIPAAHIVHTKLLSADRSKCSYQKIDKVLKILQILLIQCPHIVIFSPGNFHTQFVAAVHSGTGCPVQISPPRRLYFGSESLVSYWLRCCLTYDLTLSRCPPTMCCFEGRPEIGKYCGLKCSNLKSVQVYC